MEIVFTSAYETWYSKLKDINAKARIARQLRRFENGNYGDVKPVGEGVSETRIDYGPGYRLYHKKQGNTIIVLLLGGDKSTQANDIKKAKAIAKEHSL